MSERGIKLYLSDIKEAVKRIASYIQDLDFEKFTNDHKTIDAVIRNLSVVGEAVKNIPEEVKSKYSDIAWYEAMGMRNKVVHEYFGVDDTILWKTVKEDIPVFGQQIEKIIQDLP